MKALVTGANGMLGHALSAQLKDAGFDMRLTDIAGNTKDILFLDITDYAAAKEAVNKFKPDVIFHLAAETDVDKCQIDPEHAKLVNAGGTENMARLASGAGAVFLYVSTMGVFDGAKDTPYNEHDRPNPVNVYSRTKLEGENIVSSMLKKYYIVRAGWMMGGGGRDKKFVAKILDAIEAEEPIRAVTDKIGSPTFTKDLSRAMIELSGTGKYGLYHITNKGYCSRYDIAVKITEYLGRKDVMVEPVISDEFPLPAPRPHSEASESVKLGTLGIIPMRPWQEALKDYLDELV